MCCRSCKSGPSSVRDSFEMSAEAQAALESCQRNGVCPPIQGGQGRSAASVITNGWAMLVIWSAAFFAAGLIAGIAFG